FIIAALQQDDSAKTSSLWVAVSNSSTPTSLSTDFTEMHQIDLHEVVSGNDLWGDYPKVGWNADAVVFTVNMFTFPASTGTFDHVQVVTLQSSTLTDANSGTLTSFQVDRPGTDFTLAAASMHGAVSGAPMYFVEEGIAANTINVLQMTNVLSSTPAFTTTALSVNSYSAPPEPVDPGGTVISSGNIDSRILNSEWRKKVLVAAHTVDPGTGLATVRWYQFSPSGTPTVVQQGNVAPGAGIHTYYPAIGIAPNGSFGLSYEQSSSSQQISMYMTGRTTT